MELLVVIAIIGLLGSYVVASMNEARGKARIAKAQDQISEIRKAIAQLVIDTGEWPGHKSVEEIESGVGGNELWDLNVPLAGIVATDGNYANWNGPYLQSVPADPWGNNYFLDTDYDVEPGAGEKWAAILGSFGPNGVGQNLYDSDDVILLLASE